MNWYDNVVKEDPIPEVKTIITEKEFKRAVPNCKRPQLWAITWNLAFNDNGITDRREIANILAQYGHESQDFNRFEENLNYSISAMRRAWPSRFPTDASAAPYDRNGEGLANEVYGGRMGNDRPGDGYRYRGRGVPMLTGKYNYQKASEAIGRDLVSEPELMSIPAVSVKVAMWYWTTRVKDPLSVHDATFSINGGYNGLKDRRARFEHINRVWSN